ncbi:hypothetical protein [Thermoactinospora rubra]|uniref:hypothetical protein n=1 Tax=Thermoactinospora rubra TaxID=1088767 RepID=UPI001301BBAB|nr:hypothetical protein [Thermoactinospora rubra]
MTAQGRAEPGGRFLVPVVGEGGFFLALGVPAVLAAVVLAVFAGRLRRLMAEHDHAPAA